MILILSKTNADSPTDMVIDWLAYFGYKWKRINGEELFTGKINFNFIVNKLDEENSLTVSGSNIVQHVEVVWFRRMFDEHVFNLDVFPLTQSELFRMKDHLRAEFFAYYFLLEDLFKDKVWLSKPSQRINKVHNLILAQRCGLNIPKTLITNSKSFLVNFLYSNKTIITKSIKEASGFTHENKMYKLLTEQVSESHALRTAENFFPSLFQANIEKKFELRIFFLHDEFYAMAIFSQNDAQTSVDFRNYNFNKPNRCVPYKLPIAIQEKLKSMMSDLNLTTGSIDMIVSAEDEFVFLEVNPVGQFGMVSHPCNYYLEKKIAQYLISNCNKNE